MNNQVPAFYPEIPQEVEGYLRIVDEVVVPVCLEGDGVSIETWSSFSVLRPTLARIGNTYFDVYRSKEDVWEDTYYDAWYLSEDKQDEKLLTDLATLNVKNIDWWSR